MRTSPRRLRYPIIILALFSALASGCGRKPPESPRPAAVVQTNTPAPAAPPRLTADRLGRSELLAAADKAASAVAAGAPYPAEVTALAGRNFMVKLPFGCGGPSDMAPVRYTFDAQTSTLRFTAQPQVWTESPWAKALLASGKAEAVEGFWIQRPWLRTESCPALSQGAPAASPETVGLAQIFEVAGSRIPRRGVRAYESTVRLRPGQELMPGGLRLVLSGRIGSADGQPIRCRQEGADTRPTCLIIVELDRVAFEDLRGQVFAEWTG
jgi:hypothetical protein